MRRPRWASSRPSGVAPGLVALYWKGPPETLHTHSVRINLRPGSLLRLLVCHSRNCGFLDLWPTMGFFTTASLKWSTTAAMAKTPPSRSYRLFSGVVCLACAYALSAAANAIGEALSASPATMLRLVIEVEMSCAIAHFLGDGDRLSPPPSCEVPEHLMARGL